MEDLYNVLGVPHDADAEQIKKAYRSLAKVHHPDIQNGDEEKFRRINHAYTVLSNPDSRHDYDKTLRNFEGHTSSFDAYTADVFEVQGRQIENVLKELARQSHLTRVKIKYKDNVLIDLPFDTAAGITLAGFIFAPVLMILVNIGINRFFKMEVTNVVMNKFDEALRAHNAGSLAEAEKLYNEVIKMSDYFVPAHVNLGLLYRQRGEIKLAIACFKRVLDIAPFGELGEIARANIEALRGF